VRPAADYDQSLQVRCPREMVRNYPLGTRFKIRAKLTDKEGGGEFLSAPHQWPFSQLTNFGPAAIVCRYRLSEGEQGASL
jgi:hypothetical protein